MVRCLHRPRERVPNVTQEVPFYLLRCPGCAWADCCRYGFPRHGQIQAAATEKPAPAAQNPPAAAPQAQELPPGTIAHTAKAVTTAQFLARGHLTESSYMTVAEYVEAIAKANNGKTTFKKGEIVLVPGIEPQPIVEKTRPFPKDTEVRAIYMTGGTAGSAHGIELVRHWKQAGGNAVVFDIKDSDGTINVPFEHPLARKDQEPSDHQSAEVCALPALA